MALWDNQTLDTFRQQGDKLADDAIEQVYKSGRVDEVRRVLETLVFNDQPLPEDFPVELKDYFARTRALRPEFDSDIRAGQRLFAKHGPEVLLVLGCYSLPASYAATRGVKVLHETDYLKSYPNRRLLETTQMVVDVMTPGGLDGHGRGIRTVQKVRLMHAAVRHLIKNKKKQDGTPAWDERDGVPINQEDLAGTLMTFSYVVIDGLERLGCRLSKKDRESYLSTWKAIGRLLGVDPRLIPANFAEAKELAETIRARHFGESKAGREMTAALIKLYEERIPGEEFDGFAPTLLRFFLDKKTADDLAVPEPNPVETALVKLAAQLNRRVHRLRGPRERVLARKLGLRVVETFLAIERGNNRPKFQIPEELRRKWQRPPESLWIRLLNWLFSRVARVLPTRLSLRT